MSETSNMPATSNETSADGSLTYPAIQSLSPSRASDFMACPLRYRYRVIDRLPEPPSLPAVRGTVVHTVLENLFVAPADQRTPEHAFSLIEPAWQKVVLDQPLAATLVAQQEPADVDPHSAPPLSWEEFVTSCQQLVSSYFQLEDPTTFEPHKRELFVKTTLDNGLQLRGIVDRLDVSPQGALRVVDYKTGRAPGAGFESGALFQMRFYALVLWRERKVIPQVLQMLYLGNNLILRHQPDAEELRATQRKIIALWQAILRAYDTQQWQPRTSALCQWCAFREHLCPAWGGVTPPIPQGGAQGKATASGHGAHLTEGRQGKDKQVKDLDPTSSIQSPQVQPQSPSASPKALGFD